MKNSNDKEKENLFESLNYSKNTYNKNTYPQQSNTNNSNQAPIFKSNNTHHTINTSNSHTNNLNNGQISTYPSILHTYTKSNGNNSSTSNSISTSNNNLNSPTDNLKVAIRIRPPLPREIEKNLPFRSIAITNKSNRSCSLVEYIGAELD